MLRQWLAPALLEARQLFSSIGLQSCAGTPWGAVFFFVLTASCWAACFALSTHCRRTLVSLLRTLVDEGENFEAPRLNRLAEYRAHRA